MALSDPRVLFGVHSVTPINRTNGVPYGTARVVQGSTFTLEGDTIELFGGSNRFAWAIEDGDITAELSFSVSEYPNWLFTLFGGKAPTQGTAESGGYATAISNKKGTSIVAATGLLSTITLTTPSDLKFGRYTIVATSDNDIDVYCASDVDFGRGTAGDFLDDSLKIASAIEISTGGTDLIANYGITLTGGGSATAFVTGDSATFEIRPINTFNRTVKIGGISDVFPEFGLIAYGQKRGNGAIFEIEAYKMKAIGITLGAERKTWAQNDYTAKASYDSVQNAVCRISEVE